MRSDWDAYRADAITFTEATRAAYFRLGCVVGNAAPERDWQSRERMICAGEALIYALLSGRLQAQYVDDGGAIAVPGWAWEPVHRGDIVWGTSRLRLDGLMPDEWNRWSGAVVYVGREAFGRWLDGVNWQRVETAANRPSAFDASQRPQPIKRRLPSDAPFIPLSEALTWIAFGVALDHDRLGRALDYQSLVAADGFQKLSVATAQLCAVGTDGAIEFRGKHQRSYKQTEAAIAVSVIDPIHLHSYASFNLTHDGLDFGSGISGYTPDDHRLSLSDYPRDCYWRVTVNRAALLAYFQPDPISATAPDISDNAKPTRRRPGPAPDPDWPEVIANVTRDCIAAGYKRPLERGAKAAISTMLLTAMAAKDKHFSDDIAAKHAKKVIEALPDN
ncbi:UNVERIFIED_ORG: hypothetical protein ABIC34_003857 [Sphingomonas sp. 1057]